MTFSEAYKDGVRKLKDAGIEDSEADAGILLSYLTGKNRTFFLTHAEEVLSEELAARYGELIKRRAGHVPTQLITGVQDFMGFEFEVSENVLIPRLDTEFMVEEALREITDGARVLDLCCGSGCIIISIAKLTNGIEAVASDISDAALALTRRNAERIGAEVEVVKSDLFDSIDGKFDFILSNPPYIRSSEIPKLMEEVREHEPRLALDGGEDGLLFYRRIARDARDRLNGGGMLILEIGYDEGTAVKDILEAEGYRDIEIFTDYSGNERVIKCLKNWTT